MARRKAGTAEKAAGRRRNIYSAHFPETDRQDLEALLDGGLDDEISMMRVMMRRVMEYAAGSEDLPAAMRALESLGRAATRLAQLLKDRQQIAAAGQENLSEALSTALAELMDEIKGNP